MTKQWYSVPEVHGTNGFASATPVSDGQNVYVVFGTGIVAAYDLEGNRLWARMVEKPRMGYGGAASPVVSGDKVLVHVHHLFALDKATGETIWQPQLQWSWGTPMVSRVGETDIAVTGAGDIVRIEDGALLAKSLLKLTYCAPVVQDGIAYFIQHKGAAFKLGEAVEEDKLPTQKLWQTTPKKDRYYASPVIHDGLIYCCTQAGQFSVIDATTGEVVYEQRLALGKTCYPSVTMAGDLIFVSSDNGTTVVLKPGREYEEVAVNKLEPFRGSPVFIGDRLYIHAHKNMYCLGATDGGP